MLRAALANDAPIHKVPLGITLEELLGRFPDMRPADEPSDWEGCTDYVLKEADYKLTAHVENSVMVGCIHDTDRYRDKPHRRMRKLIDLLEFYGGNGENEFSAVMDNGYGYIYRTPDKSLRASYSYVCDIFSTSYFRLNRRTSSQAQGDQGAEDYDVKIRDALSKDK